MDKIDVPWAQGRDSPGKKTNRLMLPSYRHSPKRRLRASSNKGWETSVGNKRHRKSSKNSRIQSGLVRAAQKRPWTRSLPELQDLRQEIRTMKIVEGDMIFNANLESYKKPLPKSLLSSFQKQLDNDVYRGSLGRFPKYKLFHFLTDIPVRTLDLEHWASVLDDGALAWISQVNPSIEKLSLNNCSHIGDLGVSLFCKINTRLTILSLSRVNISPHGLQAIGAHSKRLQKVDLSHSTFLTDDHLGSIASNMIFLRALNISNCQKVTDKGVICVCKTLLKMNELYLDNLPMLTSKTISAILSSLKGLKVLSLVGSMQNMSDEVFENLIIQMKTLVSLKIPGCKKITNYTFQSLVEKHVLYGPKPTGGLPNLVLLEISDNKHVDDMTLSWIAAGCDGLQSFTLRHCHTNFDLGCRNFGYMKFLTYLDLSFCNGITDTGLRYLSLGGCGRKLKTLKFQNMNSVSDGPILMFLLSCTSVTDLDLSGTINLSDKNAAICLRKLQSVQKLNVSGLPLISKYFFETVRDYCPLIVDLNVSNCENVTSSVLKLLEESKTILKINISLCSGLEKDGITHVPNWRLTHLIARNLPNVTDESIISLANSHVELEVLDLSYNNISTRSIVQLKKKCKKLHTLNVYGCGKIQHKVLHSMSTNRDYSDFHLQQGVEKFCGIKRGVQALDRMFMKETWDQYEKLGSSADIIASAYRRYVAKSTVYSLRLLRRKRRWGGSIIIQKYVRRYLSRLRVSRMRHKIISAAYYVQYRYKKYVRNKMLMKAMRFWKLGTEHHYFDTWVRWTEKTVATRQTINARAQERKANFFARHMFEKTWMIPILHVWSKWARDTATARLLANNKMARAMAFFKSRTELTYFRVWKENRKLGPIRRKKLLRIFLQCIPLGHHNSSKQLLAIDKAIGHYNATIRYGYRHKIFDILHQNVLNMHHAMEAARHRAVMIFRNRASHAVMNTWRGYVHNRLYKRACVSRGQEHFVKTWQRKTLEKIRVYAEAKIMKRKKFSRAMKYWINTGLLKHFKKWMAFVMRVKDNRAQLAKAVHWFTRRLEMCCFTSWRMYAQREIRNRQALRKAYAGMALKMLRRCYKSWMRYTNNTQRLKVKLLLRWRHREQQYFFEKWWSVVGPIIEARKNSELAAALKLARENAAAVEIQRIIRGYLGKLEFEREKFAVSWAVKYIQGHWRMRLARKVMKAHWRHRHLKDWKKAELEHPKMMEEERISWELDAWWKAATFVSRCYRGYIARRDMYAVRAAHQKVLIEIHNEKSRAILLEAERREALRAEEHAKKIEVTIMLQCLYRMYAARKVLQWKWQGRFYFVHATKIQSMYRMRFAMHRAAARARWLYMRKKVRAKKWQTALLMRLVFGAKTRASQEKVLKKLNSLGLHPEGFVPNPFAVIKEVIFDIYYAQRDLQDILKAWKEGGFNSYKRKKAYDRIYEKHMQHNYPRKGDAVQVLMAEYRRRGETGYILNVKTINEGTNAERELALIKFDKSGQVDWLPFKQEATAYSGVLPALVRVKTRAIAVMDVEAVKSNKVALLAYAEAALELRKEYRAARLVQKAFRSRRAKIRTSTRREKVKKITKFRIRLYKRILRLMCFADNAYTRSLLIRRKIIRSKYLPEELYPESNLQPKWYREWKIQNKKRKSKAAELNVQLQARKNRVEKAQNNRGATREDMPFKIYSKKAATKARRDDIRLQVSAYPTANLLAKAAGKNRFSMKYSFFTGMANIVGGQSWKQTKDQRNTWAGLYQFQNMIDSPHCTANGIAMYHGVWNTEGKPHGQGFAVFLNGEVYGTPSSKAKHKEWYMYHSIEGFFENGIPMGPVYIVFRDRSVYEGLYNGEPSSMKVDPKLSSISAQNGEVETTGEAEAQTEAKGIEGENNNQVDVAREESTDKNQNQRISTEVEDLNPYEQNYAFLKQGIRNRSQFTDFANLQLFSPSRIQEQRDSTLKVDSPYLPQMESSIYSPYSRWESSLVRKPNPTLTSDEYESFVRIGTPQERFKLQLPPPLEEVITPDPLSTYDKKKLISRANSRPENVSSDSSDNENEGDEGFSRPGTAMTGIFSEADSQISRPRTAESNVIEESNDRHSVGEEENTDDESSANEDSASKHDSRDDEANGAEKVNEDSNADDDAAESVVTEDINASIDKVVIDELANEDEESVASSISTRSYDDKYRDPDWGTWTSPEGAKWEGYLVDNNFDPKGHDGHSGITGRFFTVDKYNETFDGDLMKGIRHGKGVYRFDDGTTYIGNWVHGKKHGQGRLEMASGEVYDGEWKDDKMHGYGVHLFPDGSTFEGQYIDGKWEGYGNYVGSNGEIYNGCYQANKRNGLGRMVYADHGRYEGEFHEDKRHGKGTFYVPFHPNEEPGMRFLPNRTPTWYRDREEFKETYIGTWVNDRMDGTSLYLVDQPTGFVLKRKGFWERGVRMKWVYTFPYQEATDYFCNLLKDPQMYRQAYGMSVVQKFPYLPDGVDPQDSRIEPIVKGLLKAWRQFKWEIDLIGMTLYQQYAPQIPLLQEAVENKREKYREMREKVLDLKEEVEEQKDLVEEEKHAFETAKAEFERLENKIQTYWDTDEIDEDDEWRHCAEQVLEKTTEEDFRIINRLVSPPNVIFEKLMKILCIIFHCEPDWNNARILCCDSDHALLMGDKTAITKGPFKIKLWNEIRKFDVYKLAADKERLERIADMAYDPLLQPSDRLIRGVSPCARLIYHLIKPALKYAIQARKLLPWKRNMVTARLDFEDAKMAYDDEVDTLKAVEEDLVGAELKAKEAAEDWRETFHESQKTVVIYEKIKRLRSGRDKNLNLGSLKVDTPTSTVASNSDSGSSTEGSTSESSSTDSDTASDGSSSDSEDHEETDGGGTFSGSEDSDSDDS